MSLTIETVDLGTTDNDHTGDTLKAGGTKIKANFSAIKIAVEALQALDTLLTGFSANAGVVAATDSVLIAFNKLVGNLAAWRVPAGGTTGQVLTKASATDNDVIWTTVSGAGIPVTTISTNITTTLAHANGMFYHPSTDTTARTITIDSNANVAYPLGTSLTFDNDISAGTLTIAITSDTLVLVGSLASTGSRTLVAGGRATAVKVAATRWRISGVSLT